MCKSSVKELATLYICQKCLTFVFVFAFCQGVFFMSLDMPLAKCARAPFKKACARATQYFLLEEH